MAKEISHQGLLLDANVLIDYCQSDRTVLKLVSVHIARLYAPGPVIRDEVHRHLNEEQCDLLGIELVEPEMDQVLAATGRPGALSFNDRLCLLIAKSNRWTLVTNDNRLRKECATQGVQVKWGLELLILLVQHNALPSDHAKRIAHHMHRLSPRMISEAILHRFSELID